MRFLFSILIFIQIILAQNIEQVSLSSSDEKLVNIFNWAKMRALAYVHDDDPVGPWYEAALPNREAFCMRDVAHQSIGASILGLNVHNKNMLLKFAENISESKDFASYWEINRYNNPAPIDYRNDKDFWYNLPANFDIVDACYRQYQWTGDEDYLTNNYFTSFYDLSLNEYVQRWQLSPENILTRNRLINLPEPAVKSNSFYFTNRGIPGYNEGGKAVMRLGIDLTAAHIAAIKAAIEINRISQNKDEVLRYKLMLENYSSFLDTVFWDTERKEYKTILYEDGSSDYAMVGENQAFSHYLLHFRAIRKLDRIKSIIETYKKNKDKIIIELASHMALIFFNYGNPLDAYEMLSIVSDEENKRRDYPENSFSIIEATTLGLMGIKANAENKRIQSLSRMPDEDQWVEMKHIAIFSSNYNVKHEGWKKSSFKNNGIETITWRAAFYGKHKKILVDGKEQKAYIGLDDIKRAFSFVDITVKSDQIIHAEVK